MVYELLLVYYSLLIMSKKYQNDLQFGMEGVLAKITPWYIYWLGDGWDTFNIGFMSY
jgi:hypothetical protein